VNDERTRKGEGADGVKQKTRTIGVVTGGGGCPGLNAVIRAVVRTAKLQRAARAEGITFGDRP
jgi:ATP-dependent phosphofructokinase / diphosphate-dependent phosphofructokinase